MGDDVSPQPNPVLPRSLLSAEVAQLIRQQILSGRLRPGQHLTEASFAETLQVSKSPVREAFKMLEAEGLIVSYPHRGSFVAKLDAQDLWELDTLRALVEPFAAQLACEKIDAEGIRRLEELVSAMGETDDEVTLSGLHARFHQEITRYAGHRRIIDVLNGLWSQMSLLLALTRFGPQDRDQVQRDHRILLDSIKERDPANTRCLFEEHVYRTLPGLLESLQDKR